MGEKGEEGAHGSQDGPDSVPTTRPQQWEWVKCEYHMTFFTTYDDLYILYGARESGFGTDMPDIREASQCMIPLVCTY